MPISPFKVAFLSAAALALIAFGATTVRGAEEPADGPVVGHTTWDARTTVGTVVAERPQTARLFELLDIDYCCGGARTLGDVAGARGLAVDRLLQVLLLLRDGGEVAAGRDWTVAPLGELMDHIVATHHAFLRRELPRLVGLVGTVTRVHGGTHPELAEVQAVYVGLQAALMPHLEDEERNVFPALRDPSAVPAADRAAMLGRLADDHDHAGAALHRLRALTRGFTPPADACALYTQMLQGLLALERDLHMHVHLENNVLLPRAREALGAR